MVNRVVIAGSSFGGLDTALKLREKNKKEEIIVIDKSSFFTSKVSLYKLISGRTKKKKITINLKKLYKKHNIRFYKDEIVQVKPLEKAIITMARKINFDYLVLAIGGVTNYFGTEGIKENSFELKKLIDAEKINKYVKEEIEKSKYYTEPINIVVCGGGLTGVEAAAELADLTRKKARVIITEAYQTIMNGFSKKAINYAEKTLKKKGVTIKTNSHIKKADKGKVILKDGTEVYGSVIIWCGGIKPDPLTHKTGLRTNEKGAIMVNDFLQTSHPHIYAIGDCSYMYKNPQPTTAFTAIQQANVVAWNIHADITKKDKKAFMPKDWPYLIALGKRKGIIIRRKSVKTGLTPSIIKKFIEKQYLFTRKHWRWPLSKIEFK